MHFKERERLEMIKGYQEMAELNRTLDKERLIRRMGRLPPEKMREVNVAIHKSSDLE